MGLHRGDLGRLADDLLRRVPRLRSHVAGVGRGAGPCALADHLPAKSRDVRLVNRLKGVSSRLIRKKDSPHRASTVGGVFGFRVIYFAGSAGGAPRSIIRQYIERQETPLPRVRGTHRNEKWGGSALYPRPTRRGFAAHPDKRDETHEIERTVEHIPVACGHNADSAHRGF